MKDRDRRRLLRDAGLLTAGSITYSLADPLRAAENQSKSIGKDYRKGFIVIDDRFPIGFDPSVEDCTAYFQDVLNDANGSTIYFPGSTYRFVISGIEEERITLPELVRVDFGESKIVVDGESFGHGNFLNARSTPPKLRYKVIEQSRNTSKLTIELGSNQPLQKNDIITLVTTNYGEKLPQGNPTHSESKYATSRFPPSFRRVLSANHPEQGVQTVLMDRDYHFTYGPLARGEPPKTMEPIYLDIQPIPLNSYCEIQGGLFDLSKYERENSVLFDLRNYARVRLSNVQFFAGTARGGSGSEPLSPKLISVESALDVSITECSALDQVLQGQAFTATNCQRVLFKSNRLEGESFGLATEVVDHAQIIDNSIHGNRTSENYEVNSSVRGIKVLGSGACTVSGNIVEGYDSGLKLEDTGRTIVSGNHIVSSDHGYERGGATCINVSHQGSPQYVETRYESVLISGNIMSGGGVGIYVAGEITTEVISESDGSRTGGTYDVAISGNVVKNISLSGIVCSAERASICGNVITNFGDTGVQLNGFDTICTGNSVHSEITENGRGGTKTAFSGRTSNDILETNNLSNLPLWPN